MSDTPKKTYTDAEKVAYYKKKYLDQAKGSKERSYYKRKYYKRSGKRPYTQKYGRNYERRLVSYNHEGAFANSFGDTAGSALGKVLGKGAKALFTALTGFGDYKIQSNTLMNGGMSPPMIKNALDKGGYLVRHREYLGDITSTVNFNIASYDINPGVATTFPWLSQVASSFEEYKFRGLVFEFKSTSSDAVLSSATSPALGTVIMATDYNSLNPNFSTKVEMENYEFANSNKPSQCIYHPVECKMSQTPVSVLYVRNQPVPAGADQRLYDLGNFQIATVGMQANGGVLGECWATYECLFFKPKFNNGYQLYTDHFNLQTFSTTAPLGTTTNNYTNQLRSISSNPNWKNSGTINGAGTGYSFPIALSYGKYLFCIWWQFTGQTTFVAPGVTTTNCTLLNYWAGDTLGVTTNSGAVNVYTGFMMGTIQITNVNASLTFGSGGTLGPAQSGDFWVMQIDTAISS